MDVIKLVEPTVVFVHSKLLIHVAVSSSMHQLSHYHFVHIKISHAL